MPGTRKLRKRSKWTGSNMFFLTYSKRIDVNCTASETEKNSIDTKPVSSAGSPLQSAGVEM